MSNSPWMMIALVGLAWAMSCSSGGVGGGGTTGAHSCQTACNNDVNVCANSDWGSIQECVADCQTEPWPQNYIECRSTTCESDSVCESWTGGPTGSGGAAGTGYTCETACSNDINVCGESDWGSIQECVTDCQTEPWPQNYIECRSATCESDSVCENW